MFSLSSIRSEPSRKRKLIPQSGSHRMIFVPSVMMITITELTEPSIQFVEENMVKVKSEFVGAMDMDWKDREKSQDQDS